MATHQQQQLQGEEGHYSHMSLDDYVKHMGGTRSLSRVLIANNGIAAVKAIRSIRKWAYETFGDDKMIQFVAMATPEDLRANAEYIHLADEFVPVPGGSNNNNYANIRLITEIAENTNCHAVWAGWGHASENPKLPDLLAETTSKIVWIGPPSHAMRALGDKIGSTLIAQSAGVPCMPWSGDGLTVDYKKAGIPADVYTKSCVESIEQAQVQADRIGYPIMIKASEGGGGKGIRRVEKAEELAFAFRQVQGEVPGSPIFIMKLAGTCRHLEVQLLCDSWGQSIAIFGRDCSIQRRHQKIIEEGPVVAAPPDIWEQMEKSAVRLAKEVGYVGAGTVEYLYMEDGSYSFLELNPRLQVEHPVTESVSGVNLPAAQLQVAMGIPLHRLPGIRRMYGESVLTDTKIEFDTRKAQTLPVHVMACRITAENPDEKFQPTSGVIQELNFRSTPDVWGYFSVSAKGLVHEFADSQFGHIFAVGATREIARKKMVLALKELEIRGEIRTTIEYLRVMIEHEEFKKNQISTTWLEGILANHSIAAEKPTQYLASVCGALYRAHQYCQQQETEYTNTLLKGHLPPVKIYPQLVNHQCDLIYQDVKYKFDVTKSGPSTYDLTLLTPKIIAPQAAKKDENGAEASSSPTPSQPASPNGGKPEVQQIQPGQMQRTFIASCDIHNLSDGGFLVLLNGKKHVIHGREFPSGLRLTVDTMTCLFQHEYDPTRLCSDTQGKLVQFLVDNGAHVQKGDPVCELEVMKMYVTIRAPESGTIHHIKSVGTVVESGDLLATFILDKPDMVKKATLFSGTFQEQENVLQNYIQPPHANLSAQQRFFDLRLRRLLQGYVVESSVVKDTIQYLVQTLADPLLPYTQFSELASNAAGRIPGPLLDKLVAITEQYKQDVVSAEINAANNSTTNSSLSNASDIFALATPLNHHTAIAQKVTFPIKELKQAIADYVDPKYAEEKNINIPATNAALAQYGITKFLQQYQFGTLAASAQSLFDYIYDFLNVEESFELSPELFQTSNSSTTTPSLEDVLHHLRKVNKDNLTHVSTLARAHHQFVARSKFISDLIDTLLQMYAAQLNSATLFVDEAQTTTLRDEWICILKRLALLNAKDAVPVSLKARQALVSLRLPSQRTRLQTTMNILEGALRKRMQLMPDFSTTNAATTNGSNNSGIFATPQQTQPQQQQGIKTIAEDRMLSPLSLQPEASTTSFNSVSLDMDQQTLAATVISDLIDQSQPIDDVLLHFLSHPSEDIRALASEAYIRRAFQHFNITKLNVLNKPTLKQLNLDNDMACLNKTLPPLVCKWEFFMEQKGAKLDNNTVIGGNLSNHPSHEALPVSPTPLTVGGGLKKSTTTQSCTNIALLAGSPESAAASPLLTPSGMCLSPTPQHLSNDSSAPQVDAVQQTQPFLQAVYRMGLLAHFHSVEDLHQSFETLLASFDHAPTNDHLPQNIRDNSSIHVLYIYITAAHFPTVQAFSDNLKSILTKYKSGLSKHKIRRVTFICPLLKENVNTKRLAVHQASSTMSPMFGALQNAAGSALMSKLSLPQPSSFALDPQATPLASGMAPLTLTPAAVPVQPQQQLPQVVEKVAFNKQQSDDFLKTSVVVTPSYLTFRCSNLTEDETNASATPVPPTPAYASNATVYLSKPVEYIEDTTIRQIEPNNALHLQLHRLAKYDYQLLPTTNRMVHLFAAIPKPTGGNKPNVTARPTYDGRRFFARVLVRKLNSVQRSRILNGKAVIESKEHGELDVTMPTTGSAEAHPESEAAFVEALNSLEIALTDANMLDKNGKNTPELMKRPGGNGQWLYNHIFVNVLVDVSVENDNSLSTKTGKKKIASINGQVLPDETLVNIEYVDNIIRTLTRNYAQKIRRLNVSHVEFALNVRVKSPLTGEINSVPIRFICENPSSMALQIAPFYEQYDPKTNQVLLIPIITRSLSNITMDKFKASIFTTPCDVAQREQPQLFPTTKTIITIPGKNGQEDHVLNCTDSTSSSYLARCHGFTDADAPYTTTFPFMRQRLGAANLETLWCYDFMEIFDKAIRRSWRTTLLSYVNILADIAFIQKAPTALYTKKDQTNIMTLLLTVLSIMFNYTDISLQSAAVSLRALIQAPLSVFKSAGIALILANQLVKDKVNAGAELQRQLVEGAITANEKQCIEQIAILLPILPTTVYNMAAEFAQMAIRIPTTFITAKELVLTPNADAKLATESANVAEQQLQGGYRAYSSQYKLVPEEREFGLNKCAMVAWEVTMYTPECLQYDINLNTQDVSGKCNSRDMILIANDITMEAGSFAIQENILFDLASQRARQYGIPRIYLSANSGARIGLADELKTQFQVGFLEGDEEFSKGFEYLYLTPEKYKELEQSVVCEKRVVKNAATGAEEERFIITDVIGKKDGIHAECLRASGVIAGETSQAYQDIFTLTFVTARTVGIGSYVARLSSRVIQKADPAMPLLLTGYQALNKLLGKSVYTSNVQLGGPDVMYTNGVSNLIVGSDLEGCINIVQWLSYTPPRKLNYVAPNNLITKLGANAPVVAYKSQHRSTLGKTLDPVTRQPTFKPENKNTLYEPRSLLIGTTPSHPVLALYQQFVTFKEKLQEMMITPNSKTEQLLLSQTPLTKGTSTNPSIAGAPEIVQEKIAKPPAATTTGLFDQFSFFEVLSGWAKGIVAGRARLGGIPVGVLTVDPRTIESTIAADPAVGDSSEVTVSRAGQVLFPESSYKFAQALFDMKNEDLPIVSLISFRGFSGGASDMQKEILKYGSYIVDALHNYTQPIIFYLPPFATLRGGAWVVIDPTINYDFMEMYSDPTASGGVLEPEGIVDIKYRKEQILAEMRRCDPLLQKQLQQLQQLQNAEKKNVADLATISQLQHEMKQRETKLFPMYLQLAITIAQYHDTPVRMLKKNVINDIVTWENAREAFYWRINAKQYEQEYVTTILAQLDQRLNQFVQQNNANAFLVTDVKPSSNNSYQHQLLEEILTKEYNLDLSVIANRGLQPNVTTTQASTIQLARALLYVWTTKELPAFAQQQSGAVATLPTTIPSYNTQINDANNNQDKFFAQFITQHKDIMEAFITAQLSKLALVKVQYDLKQLVAQFGDKSLVLELLSKM